MLLTILQVDLLQRWIFTLRAGIQPQLDPRQRLIFAEIVLAIANAWLGGNQQCFTGFRLDMVALAVAILCFAFKNQVQDIHFRIGTRLERGPGCEYLLIQYAQRGIAQQFRVKVVSKGKGVAGLQPTELGRVPSALSYTMQKLEEELDVVLFDRSGHRTKFTNVGRMLLERGRVLLEAADKLTTDAEALARGWETHLTLVTEALVPTTALYPLVDRLAEKANTQLSIITEVLAGAWERLEQGRADIVIAPDMHFRSSSEINSRKLYKVLNVYVAAPDHPIHQEPEPLSEVTRVKYRGVAVADTARERPVLTVQLLDKQPRLTVSTLEDKRQALLAGLGVATMPYPFVEKDIAEGRLRVVSPEYTSEVDIIMAWRRDSMGEAKSWCLREIQKLFVQK